MHNRIQLTKDSRRTWVNVTDIAALLTNTITIITEAVSHKGAGSDSPAEKYRLTIIANIIKLFNAENAGKLAVIGAYFRSIAYPELVTITDDDIEQLNQMIRAINPSIADPAAYMNSFVTSSRSPRDSHIAFLKAVLVPDMGVNFFTDTAIAVNSKYKEKISHLIDAALTMTEFMCTPFAVLTAEALINRDKHSGIDQQWQQMQNNINTSMQTLLSIKKSENSAKMKKAINDIPVDMQKFTGAYSTAGLRQATQGADYQALLTKYKELAAFAAGLENNTEVSPGDIIMDVDYRTSIRVYGEDWNHRYQALHQAYTALQSSLSASQQQVNILSDENAALKAEVVRLEEAAANAAQPHIEHHAPPPPPPYDNTEAVAARDEADRANAARAPIILVQLSPAEIEVKDKFLEELTKKIKKIRSSWLGTAEQREEKASKLQELVQSVRITRETKPLHEVIAAFRQTAGTEEIISKRRYTGIFDKPEKESRSKDLLDRYTRHAPQGM